MRTLGKSLLFSLSIFCFGSSVYADYPLGCAALQQCVDDVMQISLQVCQNANSTCDLASFSSNKTVDRFAVTSGQIADRAVALRKCSSKTTQARCNICYRRAKAPLKNRFIGQIFHGLLGNATQLIELERQATCSLLP